MSEILKDTTTNTIGTGVGGLSLDPAGTEVVTINNGVLIPDGTEAEPAIRLSDDTNTGIFSPANESISMVGDAGETFRATGVPSGVNYIEVTNSTTGLPVKISSTGSDTNIDVNIVPAGVGALTVNGTPVVLNGDVPTTHSHPASEIDATAITDGYVLTADGAGNAVWEASAGGGASPLTTKGDLFTYDTGDQRLPVGTDGQVLTADSAEATGVKWATASGGGATVLSDLTDVTGTDMPQSARYWRLHITAKGGDIIFINELELRESVGGATVVPVQSGAGSAVANAELSAAYAAWKAFDTIANTGNAWASGNPSPIPSWIYFDFGAGNDKSIVEYSINSTNSSSRYPSAWTLDWSDDAVTWNTIDTRSGESWSSADSWQTYNGFNSGATTNSLLQFSGTEWSAGSIGMTDLSDVLSSMTPTDGQILTYDTTNGWQAETATGADPSGYFFSGPITTAPTATGADCLALGEGANAGSADNNIAIGTTALVNSGEKNIVMGFNTNTVFSGNIVIGNAASSTGNTGSNIAIGASANCNISSNGDGIAIGRNTSCDDHGTIAIGLGATAKTDGSVMIGRSATEGSDGGSESANIAIGPSCTITSGNKRSLAVGYDCNVTGNDATAIGARVTNTTAGSARIGNEFFSVTNIMHLKDQGRLHLEGAQAAYIAPSYATASEPTAVAGAIIYDSTTNKLKFYNGTAWETITSS